MKRQSTWNSSTMNKLDTYKYNEEPIKRDSTCLKTNNEIRDSNHEKRVFVIKKIRVHTVQCNCKDN